MHDGMWAARSVDGVIAGHKEGDEDEGFDVFIIKRSQIITLQVWMIRHLKCTIQVSSAMENKRSSTVCWILAMAHKTIQLEVSQLSY